MPASFYPQAVPGFAPFGSPRGGFIGGFPGTFSPTRLGGGLGGVAAPIGLDQYGRVTNPAPRLGAFDWTSLC
jgi:hypothetical protein